jgi:hypothetical protein
MAKKPVHVTPHQMDWARGWAVKREGATRASSVHRTQTEAERAGRELAKHDHTQFLLHGRGGEIRKRGSYGRPGRPS